jgi:hypothetical protein
MTDFTELDMATIIVVKTNIRLKMVYLKEKIPSSHYNDMFLSGGAIASLIQGGQPKDWDVYFMNPIAQKVVIDLFTTDYLLSDDIAVIDEKYREMTKGDGKCITENAMTLKNDIQLITTHNGTPDEIRETFDFVHCKPYYHFGKDQLFISKEQYDLCYNKKLKVNNMKAQTTWRQSKFEQRGYTWP